MEMPTNVIAASVAGQASTPAAQGTGAPAASGGKQDFMHALNKLLGSGATDTVEELHDHAAWSAGAIPISVLMAIAPQASDSEAAELIQSLLDALNEADEEQLADLLEHPALANWLTELHQQLQQVQTNSGQTMPLIDQAALQLIVAGGLVSAEQQVDVKQQSAALVQLLQLLQHGLHTGVTGAATEHIGSDMKAMVAELSASFPQLRMLSGGQEIDARHIIRADQRFSGSERALANLLHASSANTANQSTADQGRNKLQLLERLSYMQPMAQLAASQASAITSDAATLPQDAAKLIATVETAGNHAVPPQAMMASLRGDAAAEVKTAAPDPVIRSEQFVTEMSRFVIKHMSITQHNGISHARISLMPEHLGQLDVKIQMQNGQITASFIAETAAAREMLENQLPVLRAALQQHGLQIERIVVSNQQTPGSGLYQEGREQSTGQQSDGGQRSSKSSNRDAEFALEIEDALELDPSHPEYGNTFSATA